MIIGNGVDIIEIQRVEELIKKQPRFLEKYFTEREINYFKEKQMNPETIAANFAGKEAVSKAFGTGIRGFNFIDIEILRDDLGKPYVNLYERALELSEKMNILEFMISLSHHQTTAIAFVIAVGRS